MKHIYPFATSTRQGSVTVEELSDKIVFTLDISGGAIEDEQDQQELYEVFAPVVATLRDDPRPVEFWCPQTGQHGVISGGLLVSSSGLLQ